MNEEPKGDFLEELSQIAEEYIDYIKSYNLESIHKKKYEDLKLYIPKLVDLELKIINYNKYGILRDNLENDLKIIQNTIKMRP